MSAPPPNRKDARREMSHLAMARLLREAFDEAEAEIAELPSSDDPETLHRLRVATRRMRSLLTLVPDVYDEAWTLWARHALREVGQGTNRLRDLDVMLEQWPELEACLPEELQAGAPSIVDALRDARDAEHGRVVAAWEASPMRDDWAEFGRDLLKGPAPGPRGEDEIGPMAADLILRRHKKLLRRSQKVSPDTPDEELHRLRIAAKKVRYLFEFFGPLFAKGAVRPPLKRLKRVQNALGLFNDGCVQREFLTARVPTHQEDAEALLTIGGIIGALGVLHIERRNEAIERLGRMRDKTENRRLRDALS